MAASTVAAPVRGILHVIPDTIVICGVGGGTNGLTLLLGTKSVLLCFFKCYTVCSKATSCKISAHSFSCGLRVSKEL